MHKVLIIFTTFVVTLCSNSVQSHHAFSATFMKDNKTSVEGIVTKFNFKNPHVLLYFDVTNEDGSVTNWVSEGNSATLLRRSGWDKDSYKAGDFIRVTGDSSRDGSPMTSIDFVEILDPDSQTVVETKVRDNSLELYRPDTADSVPLELADGRPNINGTWEIQYRGFGPPSVPAIPLNATGQAVQDALDLADDPQIFCDPPGLMRQSVTHHPINFTLNDDHILIKYEEFAGFRKVYFDDRAALNVKTHLGDSIARYEDNKLIIETTNLLSNLTTTEGNRISDQTTIVETYHRVDSDHDRTALNLNIVVSDPLYMAEDLVVNKVLWDAGTNYQMLENDCHAPLRERSEVNPAMNFFVATDVADAEENNCQILASSIKQGDKDWTSFTAELIASNSNEELGTGPWYNAKGELIAIEVNELRDALSSTLSLVNERGKTVSAGGVTQYCLAN